VIAVVHEVRLAPAQRDMLVRLLRSSHAARPSAIVSRLLWCEGETVHMIALWESRDALDRYLASAGLPAVTETLAMLDAQAWPRVVEVAEYG
jgi:quinol monooxygenase YgiN